MKKILVANRGEIACRVIRSCRRLGLQSVAVYSEADAGAPHVAMADEAVPIGPPRPIKSYLNIDAVLEAARATGAQAVHPGYGFLAENARFARAVEAAGLIWIGPRPESIEAMGAKDKARAIASAAGVPVVPGSDSFAAGQLDGLEAAAEQVGFPLLVKATGGGGGIGMQIVAAAADLRATVERTQTLAGNMFANGTIYLERYVGRGRHVEIQVFGDGQGGGVHLYERDCSIQRRYQKVIEETPAPDLQETLRDRMTSAAVDLCQRTRYRGAGTVEFLVDVDRGEFYFLEMNTRIQVEHPVTEMVTGTDLVAMQIDLARGAAPALVQTAIRSEGHAVECRIYAERPGKGFMPSPGQLSRLRLPRESAQVRIETGYQEGDKVTVYYDPLVAKVIGWGESRAQAIEITRAALVATEIEGIGNNLDFLIACLDHEAFARGEVFTQFIDAYKASLIP